MAAKPPAKVQAKPAPRPLVVLEEGVLMQIAADQRYLNEFPFLSRLGAPAKAAGRGGCGGCAARNRERAARLLDVKGMIAGLGPEKRARLKSLLGAAKARVRYKRGDNKMIELTF